MISQQIYDLAVRQVIQLSIVIAIVGLVTRTLCNRRPHLAYLLWVLVLIKSVTPPIWTSPTGVFSWANSQKVHSIIPSSQMPARSDAVIMMPTERIASANVQPETHGLDIQQVVIGIWAAGSLALFIIVAIRWFILRRQINKASASAPRELTELVEDLRQALGIRRRVRVQSCDLPIGPAVFGIVNPIIVVPASMLRGNRIQQLRPVLAHEMIHLRRNDPLVAGFQLLVQIIWWFNPLTWWMNRQINRVRELCCDAEVIAGLQCPPADYAQLLIDIARSRRMFLSTLPSLGIRPVEVTTRRLHHIMNGTNSFCSRTPWRYWAMFALGAIVLLPGAGISRGGATTTAAQTTKDTQILSTQPTPSALTEDQIAAVDNGKLRLMKVELRQIEDEIRLMKLEGYGENNPRILQLNDQRQVKNAEIKNYLATYNLGQAAADTKGEDNNQNPNATPAAPNKVLYDFLGQPVAPPADLNPAYRKESLTKAVQLAAQTAGISLKKIEIDDSEFPFLVGVVSDKGDCDKLNEPLRKMPGYTYSGGVGGSTVKAMSIIPYTVFPRKDIDRIERRITLRMQMLYYKIIAEPPADH